MIRCNNNGAKPSCQDDSGAWDTFLAMTQSICNLDCRVLVTTSFDRHSRRHRLMFHDRFHIRFWGPSRIMHESPWCSNGSRIYSKDTLEMTSMSEAKASRTPDINVYACTCTATPQHTRALHFGITRPRGGFHTSDAKTSSNRLKIERELRNTVSCNRYLGHGVV